MNYYIDGVWLDRKLDEQYPNQMYRGLIPTLVPWLDREDEKEVVWRRIIPGEGETKICPILMCPEDNDFSCTLIVAEIKNCGDTIQWQRVGLDKTSEWEAEKVGTIVEWFDKINNLVFSKNEYLLMINNFKQFLFDQKNIEQ
ncbi:hypothetical protein [Hymenobacter sp. B81]|uniref:hypothetical protein n=1 Tax=Hymenobacter sp. B81 TaxID=3344878 RepID=UPI0037DC58E5